MSLDALIEIASVRVPQMALTLQLAFSEFRLAISATNCPEALRLLDGPQRGDILTTASSTNR
jgi:hypothetical protein